MEGVTLSPHGLYLWLRDPKHLHALGEGTEWPRETSEQQPDGGGAKRPQKQVTKTTDASSISTHYPGIKTDGTKKPPPPPPPQSTQK